MLSFLIGNNVYTLLFYSHVKQLPLSHFICHYRATDFIQAHFPPRQALQIDAYYSECAFNKHFGEDFPVGWREVLDHWTIFVQQPT